MLADTGGSAENSSEMTPVAISKPDYEARSNLMWASSWALNGFLYDGLLQDTVCHIMKWSISAFYDTTWTRACYCCAKIVGISR